MNYSYVTLLCNDNIGYVKGVATLAKSLKLVKSNYPLSCICTQNVSEKVKEFLKTQEINIIEKETGFYPKEKLEEAAKHGSCQNYLLSTEAKFLIFTLTEFEKIVYLDADTCVFQNIDDMFNWPHMSGVEDGRNLLFQLGEGEYFNAGVLVIEPNMELFYKLCDFVLTLPTIEGWGWNDQNILRRYYRDWPSRRELHLDWNYNVFIPFLDKYPIYPEFIREEVKIAHYTIQKPFNKDIFLNEYFNKYYEIMNLIDFSQIENEIILVTAFFDIGRGEYEDFCKRNSQQYIDYFSFWAGLKNRLICFTTEEFASQIYNIRKDLGLGNRTEVIIIDDIYKLYPQRYQMMNYLENNPTFQNLRKGGRPQGAPENQAKYNYLISLKPYFIQQASKMITNTNSLITWIDFGYNHGDDLYADKNDLNYQWTYDFPNNKITYFSLNKPFNKTIIEQIVSYEEFITGGIIVIPYKLVLEYLSIINMEYNKLLSMGLMDDDQLLYVMALMDYPDKFNIMPSYWGIQLWQFGGRHIKIRENNKLGVKLTK